MDGRFFHNLLRIALVVFPRKLFVAPGAVAMIRHIGNVPSAFGVFHAKQRPDERAAWNEKSHHERVRIPNATTRE